MKPSRRSQRGRREPARTGSQRANARDERPPPRIIIAFLLVTLGASLVYLGWSWWPRGSSVRPTLRAVPPALKASVTARDDGASVATFDSAQLSSFFVACGLPGLKSPLGPIESGIAAQLEPALQALARALSTGSQAADAFGRVGQLFDFLHRGDVSSACYAEGARLAPSDFRWAHYLARRAMIDGDASAAERLFNRAIELNPRSIGSHAWLARLLMQSDRLDEAEQALARVRALEPSAPYGYTEAAQIALQRGQAAKAVEWLTPALKSAPGYRRTHALLSRAYTELGDPAMAALHERQARGGGNEAHPVPDPLEMELEQTSGSIKHLRSLSRMYHSMKDWPRLLSVVEEIVRREPANTDDKVTLAMTYMELGRNDDAIRTLETAIAARPEIARFYESRAQLAMRLRDFAGAVQWTDEALRRDPASRQSHSRRATALAALGRFDEATKNAEQLVALDPARPDGHDLLGRLLYAAGRSAEAETAFLRGLRACPDDATLQAHLSELRAASATNRASSP